MTDREMLELAAKAAGLEVCQSETLSLSDWLLVREIGDPHPFHQRWCPLHDDGDALRLAVKLGLDLIQFTEHLRIDVAGFPDVYQMHEDDPYAATRRAITRAAAEIGKSMESEA